MDRKHPVWEPKGNTTKIGQQTSGIMFSPDKTTEQLSGIIKNEIANYFEKFSRNESWLIQRRPTSSYIDAWFVKLKKGGYQDPHIHPLGWLSGVIYLTTVNDLVGKEGAIEFGVAGGHYKKTLETYTWKTFKPQRGDIVIFPSSLYHRTVPINKFEERCAVAFDLRPI